MSISKNTKKCQKCKEVGNVNEMVFVVSGKQKKWYHTECKNFLNSEKEGWNSLYDYILKQYFINELPSLLIMNLKKYRNLYTFQDMLGCLKSIEDEMKKIKYKDNQHLSNLIMFMMKDRIEDFIKSKSKKEIEHNEIENFKFLNTKREDKTIIEDYDIFD